MKKSYLLPLLSLITGFFLQMTTVFATPTVYQQLCEMNKYWEQHPISNPQLHQETLFPNHEALISFHLLNVEQTLRQNPPAHLTDKQLANRLLCLDILHTYRVAGVYPKNTRHNITIPYFIDDFNTACAVGHLIRETGFENVACRISNEMNYAYLEDMPYPEIAEWANLMGFEVDELKWIQPAYAPPVRIEHTTIPASCGVSNGSINISVIDNFTQLPVTGFDHRWYSLNGTTAGLAGEVEDLTNMPSGLYKSVVVTDMGMYPVVYDLIGLGNNSNLSIASSVQNETCTNSKDGSVTLAINGGTPPYSVRWYNQAGAMIGTGTSLQNISGFYYGGIMYELQAPQYVAEVTDAYGCKTFAEYNLMTEHESTYVYANVTKPACGAMNGIIELSYLPEGCQIAWSHDPFLTDNMAVYLAAGSYTVTITNEFGCETVNTIQLSNEGASLATLESYKYENCGQSDGELVLTYLQNVTYSWSHDVTLNSPAATNLPAGYYTVTVTDYAGCEDIYTFNIANYEFTLYPTEPYLLTNANTTNGTMGSIELTIYPEEDMQYSWSHNALLSGDLATNLTAGIYYVTVTNTQTGCDIVLQYEIYDAAFLGTSIEPNNQTFDAHVTQTSQNMLQLTYHYTGTNALQLQVFDLTGKSFASKNLGNSAGTQQVLLPIENMPSGMYLLHLSNGSKSQSIKFLIAQ